MEFTNADLTMLFKGLQASHAELAKRVAQLEVCVVISRALRAV